MTKKQSPLQLADVTVRYFFWTALVFVLSIGAFVSCSSERETPLLQPTDFPTPTPRPETSVTPEPTSAAADHFDFEYKATIKLADWEDGRVQLINQIAGYIFVQGLLYKAEIVPVPDGDYRAAIETGAVDAVLTASRADSRDWYDKVIKAGTVVDAGSPYGVDSDIRVLVRPELTRIAPEAAAVLSKLTPGEQVIADLAAQITGGRTGLKPNVVAQIYFLNHREAWTLWMPQEVVGDIDKAIEGGRNGLFRQCVLVGGGAQGGYSFCK